MKIFVSTFVAAPDFVRQRAFQYAQDAFIAKIAQRGHLFYQSSIFADYNDLFSKIEQSDIVVAFVDEHWTSSTWKMRELFYACGASPERDGKFIPERKPVLVHTNIDDANINRLFKTGSIRYFDGTVEGLAEIGY